MTAKCSANGNNTPGSNHGFCQGCTLKMELSKETADSALSNSTMTRTDKDMVCGMRLRLLLRGLEVKISQGRSGHCGAKAAWVNSVHSVHLTQLESWWRDTPWGDSNGDERVMRMGERVGDSNGDERVMRVSERISER